MAADDLAEVVSTLQANLEANREVLDSLQSLNTILISNNSPVLISEVLSKLSLPLLFSFLQTEDESQLHSVCGILDKLLCHISSSEILEYGQYVELGLQYSWAKVAKMCLQVLFRLSGEREIEEMILSPTMLHLVTDRIADNDLEIASLSTKILLQLSSRPEVLVNKLKGVWLNELGTLLHSNVTVRYRVYDLVVQTCVQGGGQCLEVVRRSDLLAQLIKELECQDPLVKMNCIELLTLLTNSKEGVAFLQSAHVLDELYSTLEASQDDVMGALIIPGIIKFFGQICGSLGPNAVVLSEKYPRFLLLVLEAVISPNEDTLWGVCVDTLGLLSSTADGRALLLAMESATMSALKMLGDVVSSSSSAAQCRVLRALAMMASCKEEEEEKPWQSSLTLQWYREIHPHLFKLILSIVRQPFAESRLAGLGVMVEMSRWEWGQREMEGCPGFLEYLLDRHSISDKRGKEEQYEIIRRLVESRCGQEVWGNVNMMKLKKYEREGPFHAPGSSAGVLVQP